MGSDIAAENSNVATAGFMKTEAAARIVNPSFTIREPSGREIPVDAPKTQCYK